MPALPDPHALAIMLLTLVALVLFAQERIALETSSLLVFVLLVAGFQLFPYESNGRPLGPRDLFAGFGHEALVAVCALMVLGKGLETTGALQPVARTLAQVWRASPTLSLLGTLLVAAALSAVVNNTPIVVMLLPILVGVTMSAGSSPSGVLMPFGLATVIGGSITTIGTSTNLLVVSVARDLGVREFAMFDFFVPLTIVGLGGIALLWLVAPRLLPARKALFADKASRLYSAMLFVEKESKVAGKPLRDLLAKAGGDLRLLEVRRRNLSLVRLPTLLLAAGDRLHVLATAGRLKELEALFGTPLHDQEESDEGAGGNDAKGTKDGREGKEGADAKDADGGRDARAGKDGKDAKAGNDGKDANGDGDTDDGEPAPPEPNEKAKEDAKQRLVEVVVTADSPLNGSTIRRVRFADDHGLYVLAIHRGQLHPEIRREELGDVLLRTGDVLLVQGSTGDIRRLKSGTSYLVLDSTIELPDTRKAPLALAIMAAVVGVAAVGLAPISVAALVGVMLMLGTGCLTWREAGSGLSASVIMIIVTSLALGVALTATGATAFVADLFVVVTSGLPPGALLGSLMLLMALLTNIISNNAAGIIGTPIAIGIAAKLGLAPEPFVVAIIAGVNLSFATPMAYQTNLLVMHAGGYRFMDFVRVGAPLALLMLVAYAVVIPRFFPF